jgi:hypothetical protein
MIKNLKNLRTLHISFNSQYNHGFLHEHDLNSLADILKSSKISFIVIEQIKKKETIRLITYLHKNKSQFADHADHPNGDRTHLLILFKKITKCNVNFIKQSRYQSQLVEQSKEIDKPKSRLIQTKKESKYRSMTNLSLEKRLRALSGSKSVQIKKNLMVIRHEFSSIKNIIFFALINLSSVSSRHFVVTKESSRLMITLI